MTQLDNGNLVPRLRERHLFAESVRRVLLHFIRNKFQENLEREQLTLDVPPANQILDFAQIKEADDPDSVFIRIILIAQGIGEKTAEIVFDFHHSLRVTKT